MCDGAKQSPILGIASPSPLSFAGTRDDVKLLVVLHLLLIYQSLCKRWGLKTLPLTTLPTGRQACLSGPPPEVVRLSAGRQGGQAGRLNPSPCLSGMQAKGEDQKEFLEMP